MKLEALHPLIAQALGPVKDLEQILNPSEDVDPDDWFHCAVKTALRGDTPFLELNGYTPVDNHGRTESEIEAVRKAHRLTMAVKRVRRAIEYPEITSYISAARYWMQETGLTLTDLGITEEDLAVVFAMERK